MSIKNQQQMELQDNTLLRTQAFVNGAWTPGRAGRTFPVYNPADGACLAQVADLDAHDTTAAVLAAEGALPAWRALPAGERSAILRRWYDLQLTHLDDLALLLTLEQGKPLAEARGEIHYGASFVEWYAEEARRAYGEIIPGHAADKRILVLRQPVGVVAAITPWNFPHAMITRKVAPALAAGCTVVIKPAEDTPLSALALAELARRAGFPPGVLNVVTTQDAAKVGTVLTQHPAVQKLSFTGSTEVGKLLMAQCATTVKKVSLELGGNAPFLVFDDADLDAAVAGAIASKYRNAGQTCVCANRILVQSTVYEAFLAKFTQAVANQPVGDGRSPGVQIGPLINQAALTKVEDLVADALAQGARILTGGQRHSLGGTFYQPTVLADAHAGMQLSQQEIFGPVAPVFRFDTEAEAIALANDTPYGLAAYFFGKDVGRIFRVAEALEYGMIGVNTGLISTPVAPFGGIKQSGFGREGGRQGIDEYLVSKYVCLEV